MIKNTEHNYGIVSKSLHWVLFLMLTFLVVAGNGLSAMPRGMEKMQAMGMHKSFGTAVLLLILVRLAWRLINTSPKSSEANSDLQNRLAHWMHILLYALMLAQPLSGILMSQAAGFSVSVFGIFELPTFIDKDRSVAQLLISAHGLIWIIMSIAVAGHIAAALYHHFVLKDNVLKRMTYGGKEN